MKKMIQEFQKNIQKNKIKFLDARNKYLILKSVNDVNLQIENESKKEVLEENEFYAHAGYLRKTEEWGKRIVNPKHDYHMNDDDFIDFLKLVHEKRLQKGWKVPAEYSHIEHYNMTTDILSREKMKNAEKEFIIVAYNCLPEQFKPNFERLTREWVYKVTDEFLELNLRLEVQ